MPRPRAGVAQWKVIAIAVAAFLVLAVIIGNIVGPDEAKQTKPAAAPTTSSAPAVASSPSPAPTAASSSAPAVPSPAATPPTAAPPAGPPPTPGPAAWAAYIRALNAIDPDIVHGKEEKAVDRGRNQCESVREHPNDRARLIDLTNQRFTSPNHDRGFGLAKAEKILDAVRTYICPGW